MGGAEWLDTPSALSTELAATAPEINLAAPAWTVAEPADVVFSNGLGFEPLYMLFLSCKYGHLSPFEQASNAKYMQGCLDFSSRESVGAEPLPPWFPGLEGLASPFLPFPLPTPLPGAAGTSFDCFSDFCFSFFSVFLVSSDLGCFSFFGFFEGFSSLASFFAGFAGTL